METTDAIGDDLRHQAREMLNRLAAGKAGTEKENWCLILGFFIDAADMGAVVGRVLAHPELGNQPDHPWLLRQRNQRYGGD